MCDVLDFTLLHEDPRFLAEAAPAQQVDIATENLRGKRPTCSLRSNRVRLQSPKGWDITAGRLMTLVVPERGVLAQEGEADAPTSTFMKAPTTVPRHSTSLFALF
jgi:hypothetical protein